jgi:hypothetical protein
LQSFRTDLSGAEKEAEKKDDLPLDLFPERKNLVSWAGFESLHYV